MRQYTRKEYFSLLWGVIFLTSGAMGEVSQVVKELDAGERVYPAMGEGKLNVSPVVLVRSGDDGNFGGDIRMAWNAEGFILDAKVLDGTAGPVREGFYMFTADSIQIGITTTPGGHKSEGYTDSCYELGFALKGADQVIHYGWQAGGKLEFDWLKVKATGERSAGGYRLNIFLPWGVLGVDPKAIPAELGVNIVFNDCSPSGLRRSVEWTPGISQVKDPRQFARVKLVRTGETKPVAWLKFEQKSYEREEVIRGMYVEYAVDKIGAERITLTASYREENEELTTMDLPEAPAGKIRSAVFSIPAKRLDREGEYRLAARTKMVVLGAASLVRTNISDTVRSKLVQVKATFKKIKDHLSGKPEFAKDFYVKLGLTLGERFIHRVETGSPDSPDGKKSPVWSKLQVIELAEVLKNTQARVEELTAGKPVLVFTPPSGVKTIRDGLFYDGTGRPVFYSGHLLFDTVDQDLLVFKDLGASLIQRERGPICIEADGSFSSSVDHIVRVLKIAHQNNLKVDMMLATHYFPGWATAGYPDINKTLQVGFLDYNIDHPQARKVVGDFLEKFVRRVKDEPAVFSFSLANEPRYANSGRDSYSRPAWIEYLKKHHGAIGKLNALYGTNYTSFDQVPVPGPEIPKAIKAKRAYYDWGRFNQEHFTDWFRWLNQFVKKQAPGIPTHVKIMPHAIYPESYLYGIDPELICGVTDLAGCDNCGAIPNAMWYDLLHSFRGQAVFDSETHLIGDNDPPTHFPPLRHKSLLFQGAMHHQPGTVLWVWDEPRNKDVSGSIYFRPANIYVAGKAMFDLNRLARELEAINLAKPRVALLYSQTSAFWEGDYAEISISLYHALTQAGQAVTFISERHLAEGRGPKVKVILLSHVTHISDAAVAGLMQFMKTGGKIIMAGEGNLIFDEYHRARKVEKGFSTCTTIDLKKDNVRQCLQANGIETSELEDLQTRTSAKGIEYRVVAYENTVLVPMINTEGNKKVLKLRFQGPARELIDGRMINPERIELDAWDVLILQMPR